LRRFFDFLADNAVIALEDVGPLHGAAYLEAMKGAKRSVATQSSTWRPCGCEELSKAIAIIESTSG
jgi:hypothetical protein